jgi:hypothetical protein
MEGLLGEPLEKGSQRRFTAGADHAAGHQIDGLFPPPPTQVSPSVQSRQRGWASQAGQAAFPERVSAPVVMPACTSPSLIAKASHSHHLRGPTVHFLDPEQYRLARQSAALVHPSPTGQRGQVEVPPQSFPVSLPFFKLSLQVGACACRRGVWVWGWVGVGEGVAAFKRTYSHWAARVMHQKMIWQDLNCNAGPLQWGMQAITCLFCYRACCNNVAMHVVMAP